MSIRSLTYRYQVGKLVAEAPAYRLYLCKQEETGRQCLLQVAANAAHNGAMERNAYFLGELKREADRLEEEYARVVRDPNKTLGYDLGFPELVDSFVCAEQGGRRINILAFRNVEDVSRMVPISNITNKDRRRVDLRTSAWIMGKALKMFAFAHSQGIVGERVILIEPSQHYVVFFDWSEAMAFPGGKVPETTSRKEISQAATAVINIMGGDPDTGSFPDDEGGKYRQYTDHLVGLAGGSQHNAERAHARFYELIDELWERAFHPFTSFEL